MRLFRSVGICMVAVFAIARCAAATASAARRKSGAASKSPRELANTPVPLHQEKVGGSYEWLPGAEKNKFTTKGGVATLQTVERHRGGM